MSRFPLDLPPGVFKNGTDFQSAGRYSDAYLVRWYGKALGPIGGWRKRSTSAITGKGRAIIAWKDNSAKTWIAVGTESNLYASDRAGAVTDITPSGFTSGRADAVASGGYGSGLYGAGYYGTPRLDTSLVQDATQWTLDTFGENLVGISPDDGKLYKWEIDTGTAAAQITGSPAGTAVVVTAEGFIFVLGSTDPRTVSWCDQRDDAVWTPDATNQAGDETLQTAGRLMCGKNVDGATLLLTDVDAWVATYQTTELVYGFVKKGDACGAISRQCVVGFNEQAAWMSPSGFWQYNGYVQRIECDVLDYIQRDINKLQASKIFGTRNALYSEIEWRYCSAGSTEIDRAVIWNYKDGTWNIGRIPRLSGTDSGVIANPLMVADDGYIYDHESGFGYDGGMPYAKTGPILLGNGDNAMNVYGLYPDDITTGDVTATFETKNNRDDLYVTRGPFTLTAQTDLRFAARQVQVQYIGAELIAWRVGTPALEISSGGKR